VAGFEPGDAGDGGTSSLDVSQGLARGLEKCLTCRGRYNLASGTMEQLGAELTLQPAHGLGERGLRDVQRRSGFRESTVIHNRDHRPELP
jgi:hypothetical protein